MSVDTKIHDAIWIANALFTRGKATGSSANLSFTHGGFLYITGSNTCFGRLNRKDFSVIDFEGNLIEGIKPSKEFPLHIELYNKNPEINAVIHTHSFYSTLWSCLNHENFYNIIPEYTPYLKMKVGTIGLIPYAAPGSEELFKLFKERINDSDGYILQNHGPILGDKSLLSTFYALEELEESARIAWELIKEDGNLIDKINVD